LLSSSAKKRWTTWSFWTRWPRCVLSLGRTIRLLMGKEQTKKLYDHLRTADGRVPVVALSNALGELMESFRAGKNSSSSPA
jgi:hypothetical protein